MANRWIFALYNFNVHTMKRTRIYPEVWEAMTFPCDVLGQWDNNGKQIKELMLRNNAVAELGISEMKLNLTKISAVDVAGNEHHILDFPGQNSLPIKGMASGHFLTSKSVMGLPHGTYTTLRFYLGGRPNVFIYNDAVSEEVNEFEYLDFAIEEGLTIKGNESPQVKLWFDLAPYRFSRHFKGLNNLFKKEKQSERPRLANSF
jgi:hypothetical protein